MQEAAGGLHVFNLCREALTGGDEMSGKDLRRHKRVPYTLDVLINNAVLVKGIDLSIGGLYVHTGRSFPAKSIVTVTFPLGMNKITIKARVQHNQSGIGMGLMFARLNELQKRVINEYMESQAKAPKQHTDKQKVLLVDENDSARRMAKSKLIMEGFSVVDVGDGLEAIKHLRQGTPDLIVLDIFMQKIDGFKILAIIKETPEWNDIPIVVFSSKGTHDVVDKVMAAGAKEFLLKMMTTPAKLSQTVKSILNIKKNR